MKSEDMKNTAKDVGASAGRAAGEATRTADNRLSGLRDGGADATQQASDAASDLYGRAKAAVRDASGNLPDSAADAMAAGQRVYDRGSVEVARHVSKQPLEALLLAGAIGYLVGWATSRN